MKAVYGVFALLALVLISGAVLWYRATTEEKPTISTILQLKWIYNAGFAGDLVAIKDDKFPDLSVTVRPGGIGVDPITTVVSGAADFGVATGDQLLLAAERGTPVVAIALAYQVNPLSWIAKTTAGISTPGEIRGKRIGLTFIDDEPLFRAMLRKLAIPESEVSTVPVKFDYGPLFHDEVDAYPVFRNTQGVELAAKLAQDGIDTNVISPSDLNIVSYSNLYFTTRAKIDADPLIVQAFVDGIVAGWLASIADPQEAAQIVSEYDEGTDPALILECVHATNKLVQPQPGTLVGMMSRDGWESTQDVLLQGDVLKRQVDLDSVFTNNFVLHAHNDD